MRPGLHRFAVLARELPTAKPGSVWLDLGGGAGEFSDLAFQRGYAVTLVDGDPRNVASVQPRGIRGVVADLNQPLDFVDEAAVDGVSLIEVIEHVPRAEQLVEEAYRVLRPGGLLLLSTPNAVWWRARLRVLFGRPLEAEGYHYRFFTVSGVLRLLTASGFTVNRVCFSSPAFGYNWFARRLLHQKKRRHVPVPRLFAGFCAQTVYVIGLKPK